MRTALTFTARGSDVIMANGKKAEFGDRLTNHESQVLELLACGLTYKEVASKLNRNVSTVRTHVHTSIIKLGAKNGTTAVLAYLSSEHRMHQAALCLAERYPPVSVEKWQQIVKSVVDSLGIAPVQTRN